MSSSARSRLEAAEMQRRYDAKNAPRISQETIDERAERLAQNARKIREDAVNLLLLGMSEDEQAVVFSTIGRTQPESLGNPAVVQATLERVRVEGQNALREAMAGGDDDELRRVWEILQSGTPESRLGTDGGIGARDARYKIFREEM